MKAPRFTDTARFSLPYVPAAQSRDPAYLALRFAQYRELQERAATPEEVVPIRKAKK